MLFWRQMKKSDLADVCQIAFLCHPNFPEDDEVLGEKYLLSPDTCFILEGENNRSLGYILAHPFKQGAIPPLNSVLGGLPQQNNTLYIHDLALLPPARGGGNGKKAIRLMRECANKKKLATLSLVAVNGSVPFWRSNGLRPMSVSQQLKRKLLTYGEDACYMTCEVKYV